MGLVIKAIAEIPSFSAPATTNNELQFAALVATKSLKNETKQNQEFREFIRFLKESD